MAFVDLLSGLEVVIDACERAPVHEGLHGTAGAPQHGTGALH
jgi:hypothetical protein